MDKVGKVAARAEVGGFLNQLLLPERCADYRPNAQPVAGRAAIRATAGRRQTKGVR